MKRLVTLMECLSVILCLCITTSYAGELMQNDMPVENKQNVLSFHVDPNGSEGAHVLAATILYVDANASGGGNGSLGNPFNKIQDGIDAALAGDIVQVAAGTYYEKITMKSGVEILGAGSGITTINGGGSGTVVNDNGADSAAKLEGFTVTNGVETYAAGGMSIYGSPTVANCIFSGNQAGDEGGGMYIFASSSISPAITNCSFVNNKANNGGGMYIRQSMATISNCTFTNNQATGVGGGIHISSSLLYGAPTITDCVFDSNKSTGSYGGGIYNGSDSSPTYGPSITNCLFKNNQAFYDGGGICNGSFSWFKVVNCTFWKNTADDGGGIANTSNSATNPKVVTNCVFYDNSASDKGGAIYNESSSPDITNCILWADTAGSSGNEIYNDGSSSPTVTYCHINGSDPQFVNPSSGDFHLQTGSPCIDAGNNSAPSLPSIDFENDQRIIDGDLNGTATVDIGVDEYTLPPASVVWVDDDFTPGSAGGHTWGYDAFDNIRDGIYEVASPGIVHVAAGHYVENINMRDGVQVLGAGSTSATIDGGGTGPSVQARFLLSSAKLAGFRIINGSWDWGGGIHVHQSSDFTISNCEITENSGIFGGGLYVYDSTLTVANCTIWHNTAEEDGAGMFFVDTSSTAIVVNCTLWENVAESSGGGIYNYDSSPTVTNCIIWGNLAGGSVGNEIYDHGTSSPTVTYCDVDGSYPGLANIDRDPAFFNVDGGNFRLRLGSPCIDRGTNAELPAWLTHDLGGQTRIMDGDDDGSSIVDMGAYEAEYTEPEIVCVDDDWVGLAPGTLVMGQCYAYEGPLVFGYDAFAGIQDGIDAAIYYCGVCVSEGTYVENLTITKSNLKLEGAGPHVTVIDGNYSGPVVTTSGVTTNGLFRGFTLINGDSGFGGGMYNSGSSLDVLNCIFQANRAGTGGGMANDASSPHVESCIFAGNIARSGGGGGIYNDASSSPELINCTFSRNVAATPGGGIYNYTGSSPVVANSILWGNVPDEMYGWPPIVEFSDIDGSGGPGTNIDENPQFVDPMGDFHLLPESPCIDAGDNSYVGYATEIDGGSRLVDGNGDGNSTVDMGADEFVDICECDLNHDGSCNILDWPYFIEDWGRTDCNEPAVDCECDLNGDGSCNILDWPYFIEDWGRTDCPTP